MRIVIALGGTALLGRGDPMTTEVPRRNIRIAAVGAVFVTFRDTRTKNVQLAH
jgi:carbamate kinase